MSVEKKINTSFQEDLVAKAQATPGLIEGLNAGSDEAFTQFFGLNGLAVSVSSIKDPS
jgi:hypothetical protein